MAEFLLWLSILLLLYAYIGYPLTIALLSLVFRNKVKTDDIEPSVSIIIAAYNEEKDIEAKLKNCFNLDYPGEKLEIIVASDGSTDNTDEIVKRFGKENSRVPVILHRVEGRLGKTAAQNSAVKICKGEIIVFSDAASMYDTKAVRKMVRNYADPSVGAVSGMYNYIKEGSSAAGLATIVFWKLENFIKSRQTKIKTITGCCGCIYSLRRELYTDLPPEIISDLVEPLMILKKGYRIVFEPEALALEETAGDSKDEFKMRIRVIVRGMNGMLFVRDLFNPRKYPFVALQLISHKLMRWMVPVFIITAFLTNAILATQEALYAFLFLLQIIFYGLAITGFFMEKKGVHKMVFYLPLYFCIVNLASLISMFKVMKKQNIVTWQTIR
jgi:cellulose synthase/poly-beta-1,6-N-acetylglucosamine synthase-like glycosyltransferase